MIDFVPIALRTERLRLRPYRADDAPALYTLMAYERTRLAQNFSRMTREITSVAAAEHYIFDQEVARSRRAAYAFGLFCSTTGTYAGHVVLKHLSRRHYQAEGAYFLAASHEGRGLMCEAWEGVLAFAYDALGLERVYVRILTDNTRSVRLAERCGFQREGVMRRAFRHTDGQYGDVYLYARLRGESTTGAPSRTD